MAEPAGQQNTSQSWRVRVCRASWKVLLFVWGTLVLGILVNVGSSWLITKNFDLAGTPLGWGVDHLWVMLFLLFLLVLLTLLSWLCSHEKQVILAHRLSQQNRAHMLKRLRLYYEQLRSQSLQGAVQVELGLAKRPTAVQNALNLSLHLPKPPEQPLPPHTSITQAYELAQGELLILGEPGAGKSTLLLELAQYLVELAEQDATQPLPVLLPLSSWATKHPPLREWLVEQVALLYGVSEGLSQQWLQGEQLLPLLDGLDEVEASQRAACIAAINAYHHEHVQPLVVCSRTSEYETAATKVQLALHSAVVVQPLSKEQVDTYLVNMGKPLKALRATLRKNTVLQNLATTPLMLQVLMLTYYGTSVRELSHKEAQLRKQIWDDYVQRMVSCKGDARRYPLQRTIAWLGWLARQMREHDQAIFLLERIEPDWLPKGQRAFCKWSIALLFGLILGLTSGLGGELGGLLSGMGGGLLFGLLVGVGSGLLFGPLFGLFVGSFPDEQADRIGLLLFGLLVGLFLGLGGGLLFGLSLGLILGPLGGLGGGLLFGLLVGLGSGMGGGLLVMLGRLLVMLSGRPVSSPGLEMLGGLVGILFVMLRFGLPLGLIGGLLTGLLTGLLVMLGVKLDSWMLGSVPAVPLGELLTERRMFAPNEGMRRSAKRGLLTGLLGGLASGLASGLIFGLLGGLLWGQIDGLFDVVQHYTLRLWLSRTRLFPWKVVPFLEDATARILLRRVVGGYQFTHRLLLDYFADLDVHPSLPSTSEPSTSSPTA